MNKITLFKSGICLLLSVSILSGCNSNSDNSGNNSSQLTSESSHGSVSSTSQTITTYTITYELNGGTNDPSNPSTYQVGTTFAFASASKTGYEFIGWFDRNDNRILGINSDTVGDLYLIAKYSANKNELTVTSQDSSRGTVAITSGSGYSGESITVTATRKLGYKFEGWYHLNVRVSSDATYTFIMPASDYSLEAYFIYDEASAISHGVTPKLSSDGKTITYGLYPQKNVNDTTLIAALNNLTTTDENGWYLYNDDYYAKVVATPKKNNFTFDNGTTIVAGTTYWFKCEPITWKVLSLSYAEYYLLSTCVLDIHCYYGSQDVRVINNYYVYPNDYEDSDIRAWLNGDFYSSAFYLDKDNIKQTLVDNSAETTNSPANHYWCNNTNDNVFLPSYQDYIKTNYGFPSTGDSTQARYSIATDWARARGAWYDAQRTNYYSYNTSYWTRSPDTYRNSLYTAWLINNMGGIGFDAVDVSSDGVRPSIKLMLD